MFLVPEAPAAWKKFIKREKLKVFHCGPSFLSLLSQTSMSKHSSIEMPSLALAEPLGTAIPSAAISAATATSLDQPSQRVAFQVDPPTATRGNIHESISTHPHQDIHLTPPHTSNHARPSCERQLGDTEASYFLPSCLPTNESDLQGVNDMYLHLTFRAPPELVTKSRLTLVWATIRQMHPLLASKVVMNNVDDIYFSYVVYA